jgi:hypothetical protein
MKKLLLITSILLISLNCFSQKTSVDVLEKINAIIGKNIIILDSTTIDNKYIIVNPELLNLYNEHARLEEREIRFNVVIEKLANIIPMIPASSCFICRCNHCGCIKTEGSCSNYPGGCSGNCLCCGYGHWTELVMNCAGGMCGNQQGAN